MRQGPDLPAVLDVEVTTHGQLPGSEDYARTKIGELGRLTHQPVLHAHVRLSEHGDPAVARRVIAQANLDVNGRLVRAQVEGVTAAEAIDRLVGAPASSTGTQRRTLGSQARLHLFGWFAANGGASPSPHTGRLDFLLTPQKRTPNQRVRSRTACQPVLSDDALVAMKPLDDHFTCSQRRARSRTACCIAKAPA